MRTLSGAGVIFVHGEQRLRWIGGSWGVSVDTTK